MLPVLDTHFLCYSNFVQRSKAFIGIVVNFQLEYTFAIVENFPAFLRWEKDGQISRECWLKAGEQGLLGTDTPDQFGGIGGDFKDAAIIMEEQ